MDGTFGVWDMLVSQDIEAGVFEMKDFASAVNKGIRTPMYNRIDYSDIYEHAKQIHKKRIIKKNDKEFQDRARDSGVTMPTDIKDILKKCDTIVDSL